MHALQDFSLAVETGEVFGFLGPNGAGKTTAIHLAMGFMRPSSGTGYMLGAAFGKAEVRRRVGFLAESVALYHRPASTLVRFYGGLNRVGPSELRQRTREVLEAVGLTADASRNVGKFSRGMLQRMGLAQALVNDPELLILDEPTSALDPLARVTIRELLLDLRRRGRTIFISSHLLSEIELICDRVAIMNHGRIVRIGRTGDLLQSHEESEIMARGVEPSALAPFRVADMPDSMVRLHVRATEQRAAIERVWSAGGEVLSVNPARKSLEQIFVELTGEPASREQAEGN